MRSMLVPRSRCCPVCLLHRKRERIVQRAYWVVHVLALVAHGGWGRAAVRPILAVAKRVFPLHYGMYLPRPFIDYRAAAVAQVALDGVLGRIAVRPVHLYCVVGALEGDVASVPLGYGGLAGGLHAVVLHPADAVAEEARSLYTQHHLGDHLLH